MLPSSEIIVQFLKYQKLSLGIYLRFMSKTCVHLKDSTLLKHAPSHSRIRKEKKKMEDHVHLKIDYVRFRLDDLSRLRCLQTPKSIYLPSTGLNIV